MFATYNIKIKAMIKSDAFSTELQELARFAKVISHPARLAILRYLAETKTCISGDISDFLPLSRSTVSQHLNELKELGLIHGEIDGLKVNYCLCCSSIDDYLRKFDSFFEPVKAANIQCITDCTTESNSKDIISKVI